MIGSRDITNERSERTSTGRIDRLENPDDQFFQLDVADNDLRVAGAADHSGIAALERNCLYALVHFLNVAARFLDRPFGQAVEAVGEAAMSVGVVDDCQIV